MLLLSSKKNPLVYAVIGSSAGGFEALSQMLSELSYDTGFYFFIVQHHSRTEKSILAGLLDKLGSIRVHTLSQESIFTPNTIYVIPPELSLSVNEYQELKVLPVEETTPAPLPNIDAILGELCKIKNAKIIAIILSGSGNDGTKGVKKVKESGGITMAQSPNEAIFASMPEHAIETKMVDYTLNVKDISDKLLKISHALKNGTYKTQELPFDAIRKILYQEKHLDLFKYKDETITRRIEKRMKILNITSLKKYAIYIKEHHEEIEILNNEILIGVTEFFRGKESFAALKTILINKINSLNDNSEFRIWSVACSSGEEAYSLAILIDAICEELQKPLHVRIFATDIDEIALQKARSALYTPQSLENLSDSYRAKYFTKEKDNYQIIKRLRDQIVFAHHNFLQDPPFINIDLLTCRNILIYITRSIQSDLFSLFHFALKESGVLFLGASETIQESLKLFSTLDTKYRIYAKEEYTPAKHPTFQANVTFHHLKPSRLKEENPRMQAINPIIIEEQLKAHLFDYFKEGCLIVDRDNTIIYKKGEIPYLHFGDGILSLNLYDNLDKTLHYNTRILLKHVTISNKIESTNFIYITDEAFVKISAQPFYLEKYKPMVLLNFNKIDAQNMLFNGNTLPNFSENSMIVTLSKQLVETKEEIMNISNELLLSKQNMELINEELQDSNEKLQSTVEELETSNEELQSSNEELLASLSSKKELQNKLTLLLDSSLDGIIGLDIEARHTFVNLKAAKLLGYSQEYLIGKESHQIWHHTKADGSFYPESECPINRVLQYGEENRGEDLFWRGDGTSFPVNLIQSPITEDGKIVGALVVFQDISLQKEQERQSKHEQELINTYLEIAGIIILILDNDSNILMINDAGCKLLGASKEALIGLNWFENFIDKNELSQIEKVFYMHTKKNTSQISRHINKIIDMKKNEHLIAWNNATYTDGRGNIIGVIATGNDITKEEYLTLELSQTNLKYTKTFEAAQIGIAHVGLDGSWLDANHYLCKLVGYTKEELLKLTFQDITYKDDLDKDMLKVQELLDAKADKYSMEKRYIKKNGDLVWARLSVILIRNDEKQPLYFISIIEDISQMKMLTLELESRKNELENVIRFAPNPIMLFNENGKILIINNAWKELTGYSLKDISTLDMWNNKACKMAQNCNAIDIEKLFDENMRLNMGEIKIVTKENKELTWMFSIAPLENSYDSMKVFIASAMDITQMQKNEELMLLQSRQAAMGDMIGMIAHQWRQPLSVIGMVANNLKASLALKQNVAVEDIEKLTAVLDEQTQYLSQTIDDFRTFFKPEKAKEKIVLCNIYDKLQNMLLKTLQNNNIALQFSSNCDIELFTYPNELIQVLVNLINNAKDAMKERQILKGKIEINTKINTKDIIITVQDNAGGIDKSIIENLGEPYATTKNQNGTGLGIYMSLMILNKHFHGNLTWKNCNEGSCFMIQLPLQFTQEEQ